MAYIFTNIITTLPFGYWVKVELIKAPGSGSDTVTNGGYIHALSGGKQSVDLRPGKIKPGQISLEMFNRGAIASAKIFTSTIDAIELRVWLSYDAGTSWESAFAGFVRLQSIRHREYSTTLTELRVYSCTAEDYMLALKNEAVDFEAHPITSLITLPADAPVYSTDETGSPFQINTSSYSGTSRGGATRTITRPDEYIYARQFALFSELLSYIIGRVPFIAGATAPSTAIDYSDLEHTFYNHNTGLTYGFDKLALWYWAYNTPLRPYPYEFSFFGPEGGPGGAYDAGNLQELLSRLVHSLAIVPIPRLHDVGGTLTYTVYFMHRISSSTPSVGGTLEPLLARAFEPAPWADGVSVETIGLPKKSQQAGIYGGSAFNQRNYWYTSPSFSASVDPYIWWQAYLDPENNEAFSQNATAGSGQLFVQTGASAVRNVHKCKILSSQSLFEASGIGWYGMQEALFDLVAGNATSNLYAGLKTGYDLEYHTLRGTDLWDLRMLKKLPVAGSNYVIESIERNILQNISKIRAVKLAA